MLLTNDLGGSGGVSATDRSVVTERRKKQRDREIFMLAHMWKLYTDFEKRNNDPSRTTDNDPNRRYLSTCLATCMNIFIDATDEEGLAHLAGLILLYCRTMDTYAIGDARYAELRAAFSVFDPAVVALKWRQVEHMCVIAQDRAARNGGVYLSEYTREGMIGRTKVGDNPPECLFELYERADKRRVWNISDETLNNKTFANYALRCINQDPWRPPKTPPWFLQYPTSHFSRVVSSNGVAYDLMSRLDNHDKRGLVCYQPHKTRHRLSDFAQIAESVVPTTPCEHRMMPFCYIDHAWYEVNVTSVVLLDGTRYIFADNAGKSSTPFMLVRVFRAPVNERSDVDSRRANGDLLNAKNHSGFTLGPTTTELSLYPSPPANVTAQSSPILVATYDGAMGDKHDVLVQTQMEGGVGDYTFNEYNSILLRIPKDARAIVRVQHRRTSSSTSGGGGGTIDRRGRDENRGIDDGVQNYWLGDDATTAVKTTRSTWKYDLRDERNYRHVGTDKVVASIVIDNYVIPITNSATHANNFSERAVSLLPAVAAARQ